MSWQESLPVEIQSTACPYWERSALTSTLNSRYKAPHQPQVLYKVIYCFIPQHHWNLVHIANVCICSLMFNILTTYAQSLDKCFSFLKLCFTSLWDSWKLIILPHVLGSTHSITFGNSSSSLLNTKENRSG